jgi:hypothetical protein
VDRKSWELQDVRLRRGETPPDLPLARHSIDQMTIGKASEAVYTRMRSHIAARAKVDCVRVLNERGEVVAAVTAEEVGETKAE